MVESSKIVAVTGASGYIGARLLRELEEENLERLVAIDIKPPPMPVHNVAVYRQDVGRLFDAPLRQRRVTTLVHLAFVPNRGRNRREVREIRETNLRTMHVVLDSCDRAGRSRGSTRNCGDFARRPARAPSVGCASPPS